MLFSGLRLVKACFVDGFSRLQATRLEVTGLLASGFYAGMRLWLAVEAG